VSMFDEFNEGNQIAKTAETARDVPAGAGIRPLDEDGVACSADYYLRITADGGRMLKKQIPLTPVRPTQPFVGTTQPTGDLAVGRPVAASSVNSGFAAGNAVDADPGSYWESTNGVFPQWFQVDLGAVTGVGRLVLRLPGGWEARAQTITVQGGADGGSWTTLAGSAGHRFDPASGNTVTIRLSGAGVRFLRLTITANTGWPAGQVSSFEAYAG
jgi:hypothetical protein